MGAEGQSLDRTKPDVVILYKGTKDVWINADNYRRHAIPVAQAGHFTQGVTGDERGEVRSFLRLKRATRFYKLNSPLNPKSQLYDRSLRKIRAGVALIGNNGVCLTDSRINLPRALIKNEARDPVVYHYDGQTLQTVTSVDPIIEYRALKMLEQIGIVTAPGFTEIFMAYQIARGETPISLSDDDYRVMPDISHKLPWAERYNLSYAHMSSATAGTNLMKTVNEMVPPQNELEAAIVALNNASIPIDTTGLKRETGREKLELTELLARVIKERGIPFGEKK